MIDGNDVYVPNRSGLSFHDIFSLHSYGRGRVVCWGGGGVVGVRYRVLLNVVDIFPYVFRVTIEFWYLFIQLSPRCLLFISKPSLDCWELLVLFYLLQ